MTTPNLTIPAGPGTVEAAGTRLSADAALEFEHANDSPGDTIATLAIVVTNVERGYLLDGTTIGIELTAGDVDLIGAFANGRWTCAAGHPTTPPVVFEGGEYRFCPQCDRDFANGDRSDSGIIVMAREEA